MTADPFASPTRKRQPMDAKIPRDQWDRYVLPDPITGEACDCKRSHRCGWVRATTLAGELDSGHALADWRERMAVKGIALRADLYALAAATPLADKHELQSIAQKAKDHAGAADGANLGTALHAFCEQIDSGQESTVPAQWRPHVDAYRVKLAADGITVLPDMIERVGAVASIHTAGTFDRIVRLSDGRNVIGDLKTGASLDYIQMKTAIQCAIYSRFDCLYQVTVRGVERVPMPEVDQSTAVVIWLPAVREGSDVICEIHEFDIEKGWAKVALAMDVRNARKETYSRPYVPPMSAPAQSMIVSALETAKTVGELSTIFHRYASTWSDELTEIGLRRKAELQMEVNA